MELLQWKETATIKFRGGILMPIAEVTVIPIGTGSTSLSSYVADMQRVLKTVEGLLMNLRLWVRSSKGLCNAFLPR